MQKILLASKSPRRIELLAGMGLKFDVKPTDADESSVHAATPALTVKGIAELKARTAFDADGGEHDFIFAADTLVEAPDGKVLGKPKDAEDAKRMLRLLSGTHHYVHTGIAVIKGGKAVSAVESTAVRFLEITEKELDDYVATGEPMDKAGAYGIQELGGLFVSGIDGDYFNVMGLPLCRLNLLLKESFGTSLTELAKE